MTEYTLFVPDTDLRQVVKPMVSYLQAKLQKLYPELEFNFPDDEFVRNVPGLYSFIVDWYMLPERTGQQPEDYIINTIELIRPLDIQRELLQVAQPLPLLPFCTELFSALQIHTRQLEKDWELEAYQNYRFLFKW